MSTTKKLRLGPLPKTESTKLTFLCPVSLKADLDRYAVAHSQAYGEAVDATRKSIDAAAKKFEQVDVRTRVIQRKLRDVQELPAPDAASLAELPQE